MDLAQCTKMLENCIKFLENYRKDGFKQAMIGARELADELQIEPIFKPLKRVRRVILMKTHRMNQLSPEKNWKLNFITHC